MIVPVLAAATPPLDHPVSPGGQTFVAVLAFALAAASFGYAVRESRRLSSPVPVVLAVAVPLSSVCEPLYDSYYHLIWYRQGQWNLYTAVGVAQPIWIPAAWVVAYVSPMLYIMGRVRAGLRRHELTRIVVGLLVADAGFELLMINLGTYEYWGPNVFAITRYPLWIAAFNVCVTVVGALVTAALLPRARGMLALAPILLFPMVFCAVSFALAAPALNLLSQDDPDLVLLGVGAAVGDLLTFAVIRWTAMLLLPLGTAAPAAHAGR